MFRYLTENLHSDLVSISVDITYSRSAKMRELSEDSSVDYILLSLSILFIMAKMGLLGFFIVASSKVTSKNNFLLQDLNKNKKCRLFMYFTHFILTRVILAILVLLTPFVSSKICLGIAAVF